MATAISNASSLEWHGASDGSQPVIRLYPEGTSETFKKGDLVVFDQSENGLVVVPQGDGGVYGDTGTADDEVADVYTMLGIALEDASGTAGTLLQVLIPRPNDFFTCVLFSTDNTTIVAPDIDNIGNAVDLIKGDSNNNLVTGVLENNTGTWGQIVDINPQDTSARGGTIGATLPTYSAGDRVVFRFFPSALSATGAIA